MSTPSKTVPVTYVTPSKGEAMTITTFMKALNTLLPDGKGTPEALLREDPVSVERTGDKIIIPDGMSYEEAHKWLQRQEEAEEKKVAIFHELKCFPLDGMVALSRAMSQIYGFTDLTGRSGFWGDQPPLMIQIPTGDGKHVTAPMSRIASPKWEGGYLEPGLSPNCTLRITGEVKLKFEQEIKNVLTLTGELLATSSIYKGRAIRVDLEWMDGKRKFEVLKDAPEFWRVDQIDPAQLILSRQTEFEIATSFWCLIEQTDACRLNRIPLKHGAILYGSFGVGKTLTARVTARKAVENGWTFIYLKNVEHLQQCLQLATLYAPAVVFAEDVDQVTDGGRDEELNTLLNMLDGVDTKDQPIITVLTTNHHERINPAILRPGRIDSLIEMGAPDAEAAQRFIKVYAVDEKGRSLLAPDTDMTEAGEAMAGLVPAFIAECVQQAKRFTIHREGVSDIVGKMLPDDLIKAARSKQDHVKLTQQPDEMTAERQVVKATRIMGHILTGGDLEEVGNLNGDH